MKKKIGMSLLTGVALAAAWANFGCAATTAALSGPSTTYIVVGRNMYHCQAVAGSRPVCTMVTEQ